MNKILYILLQIIALNCIGQNLVPNPNFEQYTICPDNWTQLSYCQFWNSYGETPDYFNTCSSFANITPPNCFSGFQYPHSGSAYIGFISYSTFGSYTNYRETIGANLLSSLVINQKYFISFYVNLGGQNQATIASNKIGVKFSTVFYSYNNSAPINNFAHFYSNDIITDTVKWTKISGSFIADSTYNYIIIGNFFNDSLTDTILLSLGNTAYYYLDDVCVTTDSLYNDNWTGINEHIINKSINITIYPNPANDNIYIVNNDNSSKEILVNIYNNQGKQIMDNKFKNQYIIELDVSKLTKGIYMVKTQTDNRVVTNKLVIQ